MSVEDSPPDLPWYFKISPEKLEEIQSRYVSAGSADTYNVKGYGKGKDKSNGKDKGAHGKGKGKGKQTGGKGKDKEGMPFLQTIVE